MAVVPGEPDVDACKGALAADKHVPISAGTVAEALIVARARNTGVEMAEVVDRFGFDVLPVTPAVALRIANANARWGRVHHAAGLNFGDCFAYVAAKDNACRLLFAGEDSAKAGKASVRRATPDRATAGFLAATERGRRRQDDLFFRNRQGAR
jgi:ribonuclease VapC